MHVQEIAMNKDQAKAFDFPRHKAGISRLCSLLAGCCLLAAAHPVAAYESRGARSCQGWQESRLDQKAGFSLNAEIYATWMVGYLSGIVAGSGNDFYVGTDNESVFLMVDDFCVANFRMNLAAAGTSVARQLMQEKGIVNRPTLP
jgi:hypothetical protein